MAIGIMCIRGFAVLLLAGLSLSAQALLEKEAALGKQLAAEVHRNTTAMDNPIVQKYLDQLWKKLAAQMPEARFPFTFSAVAEDPCRTTHQPAALPGGYVFVPAALFLAAQDEAEFAGMLADAMEYTQQRPAARGTVAYGSSIPLVFIGSWSGACFDARAIAPAWVASERRAESAADVRAVQAMARAGFDPHALVRYVERIEYPPSVRYERVAALSAAIEKLPVTDNAAVQSDNFATARQEVRRLVEQPVRPNAAPSLVRKTPE